MLTWPAGALGMMRGTVKMPARGSFLDQHAAIIVLDRLGAEDAGADDRADARRYWSSVDDDAGMAASPRRAAIDAQQAEAVHRHQPLAVDAVLGQLLDLGADPDLQVVQRRRW